MTSIELQTLLEQVNAKKEQYRNARLRRDRMPGRNKYATALCQLRDNDLPLIELDKTVFTNESETSMQSQFKKTAEKKKLPNYYFCFIGTDKVLVDFDRDGAEELFDNYVMERAGITPEQLAAITTDLDAATRDLELPEDNQDNDQ